MNKPINVDKIIHNILNSINWEYVCHSYQKLELTFNGKKKVSQKQLAADLRELLIDVIKTKKSFVSANKWLIYYFEDKDMFTLEVNFAPISSYQDSFGKIDKYLEAQQLKKQLDFAKEAENYERAAKIQQLIDKIDLDLE